VIPWDPAWLTATAEDAGVLVEVGDGGGVEALNLRAASWWDRFLIDWRLALSWAAERTRSGDLVADALSVRTAANTGRYDGRGSGATPKRVGILTASEVLSGRVGHVVAAAGLTQWGPGATIGPLATRVEHPGSSPKGYPAGLSPGAQPHTVVPAGTRLVLPMFPDEIGRWAAQRGYRGALAVSAATVARALGEYGWCHGAETGVGDPQIETTGVRNPAEAARWRQAGITSPAVAATLLDGLPWERVEVRA
jgi:hypothetical protein